MISCTLSNTNKSHTVIRYQVFLSNTNNLHTILWYQVFLQEKHAKSELSTGKRSAFEETKSQIRTVNLKTRTVIQEHLKLAQVLIVRSHHHAMPLARTSLTLSRHFSLSFIASGRSSGLHPVSSHSCCMYVRACRPAFARPYVGVHRSISLMSSPLLLQQCPACLVRLTWIVFVMCGRYYLPTPPLGHDMTQGQFFKRSLTGLNSEFSFS